MSVEINDLNHDLLDYTTSVIAWISEVYSWKRWPRREGSTFLEKLVNEVDAKLKLSKEINNRTEEVFSLLMRIPFLKGSMKEIYELCESELSKEITSCIDSGRAVDKMFVAGLYFVIYNTAFFLLVPRLCLGTYMCGKLSFPFNSVPKLEFGNQ